MFHFTAQAKSQLCYLEANQRSELAIHITSQDPLAHKVRYQLYWSLPKGAQGRLYDKQGHELRQGQALALGDHALLYEPQTVGEHQLTLSLRDPYGDQGPTCELIITAEEHEEVPFSITLTPVHPELLTHRQGTLVLALKGSAPQANALRYRIKALNVDPEAGVLLAADGLTPIGPGDALILGEQCLVFQPQPDTSKPVVSIGMDVCNEKGDTRKVSALLKLAQASYVVDAQLMPARRNHEVPFVVRVHAPGLSREQWHLTGWELTGGLSGTLRHAHQGALACYPLQGGSNHFTLFLEPSTLQRTPELCLTVTGLYGEELSLQLDLSAPLREYTAHQIEVVKDKLVEATSRVQVLLDAHASLSQLRAIQDLQNQSLLDAEVQRLAANVEILSEDLLTQSFERMMREEKDTFDQTLEALDQAIHHFEGLSRGINETDRCGDLPLHDAARWGDLDLVRFLIGRTLSLNHENHIGQTALDKAAPCSEVYYLLSSSGVNLGIDGQVRDRFGRGVNEKNKQGHPPLYASVCQEDESAVRLVLRHPQVLIDETVEDWNALCKAVRIGNLSLVKLLVNHGADVNVNYTFSEHNIKLSPPHRHYPSEYENSTRLNINPLFLSREWKHKEIAQYLLQQDVKERPRTETYFDGAYYRSGAWRQKI